MNGRLLVIDNEPFDRKIMAKVFSAEYHVRFANNPQTSLEVCQEFQPQVLLFELRTRDQISLQEMCYVRDQYNPLIPLLVVVSNNAYELEQFARMQQVFYYLIRPFNFKELWDSLEDAFSYFNKRKMHIQGKRSRFESKIRIRVHKDNVSCHHNKLSQY